MCCKRVLRKTQCSSATLSLTEKNFSGSFRDLLTMRWNCESSWRVASSSFSCHSDNFHRFAFYKRADRKRFLGSVLTVYRRVCCNDASICDATAPCLLNKVIV